MATVKRTESAHDYHTQTEQHIRAHVTWASPSIQETTPGYCIGALPANALKKDTYVRVNTSFDGLITVGTSTAQAAFGTTEDFTMGTAGTYITDRNDLAERSSVDRKVYVFLSSGSTVGDADVWVSFLPAPDRYRTT